MGSAYPDWFEEVRHYWAGHTAAAAGNKRPPSIEPSIESPLQKSATPETKPAGTEQASARAHRVNDQETLGAHD